VVLPRVAFFTGGGPKHDAVQTRLTLLGNGAEGIIGRESLMVRALSTPGSQVRIGDGAFRIKGRVNPWQGLYAAYNIGDHIVDVPANNTANTRYDLLVIRVEDPDFEGTRDRLVDDLIFPELITNVGSTVRTLAAAGKPGYSAIPVARLVIPANTAAINGSMIDTGPRFLAEPQTRRRLYRFDFSVADSLNIKAPEQERFPQDAFWDIDVPEWATRAWITGYVSGVKVTRDGYAKLWVGLHDQNTSITQINEGAISNAYDLKSYPFGGRIDIDPSWAGATRRLNILGQLGDISNVFLYSDGNTTGLVDVQFEEHLY
jgi:hypothetical protein